LQRKPGYRQIAISVMDESGRKVLNLSKDDFAAKIDDESVPILFAEYQADGPASVLILVDTSGSSLAKLAQTPEAITQVVNNLDPRDDVALFAFSNKPFNLQPFTQDHSAIIDRETLLHAVGSTSLFDSVITAARILRQGCYARRALVVISDGIENTSGKSLEEARHDIKMGGVSAYAIAIGSSDTWSSTSRRFLAPFVTKEDADSLDEKSLGYLVNPSGGSTFRVAETGDRDLLVAVAKAIMVDSRGQYVMGFIDPPKAVAGALTIQIKNHEDYAVTR
jgi:Ca-activated chloride channel family protein